MGGEGGQGSCPEEVTGSSQGHTEAQASTRSILWVILESPISLMFTSLDCGRKLEEHLSTQQRIGGGNTENKQELVASDFE